MSVTVLELKKGSGSSIVDADAVSAPILCHLNVIRMSFSRHFHVIRMSFSRHFHVKLPSLAALTPAS